MQRNSTTRGARPSSEPGGADDDTCVNQVILVGRVSAPASEKSLPSGDVLVLGRLVVDRPPRSPAPPAGVRPVTIDTFDCVATGPAMQRSLRGWQAGDVVRVEGALRRRFWRGAQGLASRYEVEVLRCRRLARPS